MATGSTPSLESIGNYDLEAKIAEGGMGAVYRARNRTTGQIVAIKIVPAHTARNQTLLRRFEREFAAAHNIDHPNVVKAIEFCGKVATPFLVMEYVHGESLGQRIARVGRLSEDEAKHIFVQVCQGLHRAHKHHLVHRDIKPDNVLLTADNVAKITDLGLVKGLGEEELNLTRTGRGLGTPHFMAPEQFRDAKNADVRCDVYSIGATLYMAVTGVMPFEGGGPLDCWMKKISNEFEPPKNLHPQLSDRMNWAILRAMSADPEKRPASCREFVEDLLGKSTRPVSAASQGNETVDLWYLTYQDEEEQSHTVKGTTAGIRRALEDHLLGNAENILGSRLKQGPFEPLKSYPEFRDLLVTAAPLPSGTTSRPSPARSARMTIPGDTKEPTPVSGRISGRVPHPSARMASPSGRMAPSSARMAPPSSQTSFPSGRIKIEHQTTDTPTGPYTPVDDISRFPKYELPDLQGNVRRRDKIEWAMWFMLGILSLATAVAVYYHFFK